MTQPSLDDALREGRRRRDEGMSRAVDAAQPWDVSVIDKAIAELASTGRRFSANDTRALLPEVRRAAIGGRFAYAARQGLIERTGRYVQSTDPGTHAHVIAEWQGVVLGFEQPRDGAA